MNKFSRNQRVAAITKILTENPNKLINLNLFTKMFGAAKSTISEDIVIVRESFNKLTLGRIETVSGAGGGIKYICDISDEESKAFAEELCNTLRDKSRVMQGRFIYMTDIMYDPHIIHKAGLVLSSTFNHLDIDSVVTVETKGIPLAYEVAKQLGVQLVIVRRDARVTEGTTVSINYISGSSDRIQNMSLSKKALNKGSKCIFVDDFMKGGGTALGIINLLEEFESELLGIGVLINNIENPNKKVKEFISIAEFNGVDNDGISKIFPSSLFK